MNNWWKIVKKREKWRKIDENWPKTLIIDEKLYTNDEISWVIDKMQWNDRLLPQKLVISPTLSQIVRFLDHFWLIERWQGIIRSCWENSNNSNNDIFTLILAKQAPKPLFLRAVLSEIVTIPK